MNNWKINPKKLKTKSKAFTGYETHIISGVFLLLSLIGLSGTTIPFVDFNILKETSKWIGFWAKPVFVFASYFSIMNLMRRKVHGFLLSKYGALVLYMISITIFFSEKAGIMGIKIKTLMAKLLWLPIWKIIAILIFISATSLMIYHSWNNIFKRIAHLIKNRHNPKKFKTSDVPVRSMITNPAASSKVIENTPSLEVAPAREINSLMDLISRKGASQKPIYKSSTEPTPTQKVKTTSERLKIKDPYVIPSKDLLSDTYVNRKHAQNIEQAQITSEPLMMVLKNFSIPAEIINITVGPSVTRFELKLQAGIKVSKILSVEDNIKMALAARTIRIQAPIPGKAAIGIEIPNRFPSLVDFKTVIKDQPKEQRKNPLSCGLGKDIEGKTVFIEINKTPHMLVAGATGSGKSVCMNTILASILLHASPEEVRLLLIDPKMVEFAAFAGIPHLVAPIITNPARATLALAQAVEEMEKRYQLLAKSGSRKIDEYNAKVPKKDRMPYLVIVIDELADLMMVASKEVEISIARITQKARASGIHLIVSTQRPSTDVVTGLIKSNIPTRISFSVASSIDSRTILDSTGAEKLLGRGDMLLRNPGSQNLERIQGAFIDDQEVSIIIEAVKSQREPDYIDEYVNLEAKKPASNARVTATEDDLYDDVKRFVIETRKASSSSLQRRFAIGYGRAARLIDALEFEGICGPARGSKPREVLID